MPLYDELWEHERFHVEDDRRVRDEETVRPRRSRLGLDEPQTTGQKLALSLACLVVFTLLTPALTVGLVHVQRWPQPWRFMTLLVAEVVFIFLLLVIVYLWWKPAWFKDVYLAVEAKMLFLVYSLPLWVLVAAATAAIMNG